MNRLQFLVSRMRIQNRTQLNSIINHIKPTSDLLFSISSSLFVSSSCRLNFSSHTSSQSNSYSLQTTNSDSSSQLDDAPIDDVSTPELKQRIDRYIGGDIEALPSIFEAILARKLSGKHEESDDELMVGFQSKSEQVEDQKFQSDEDDSEEDLTDSDEELSD